jgi:hypothetical protein
MNNEDVRQSVMSPNTWVRGLYMLLFALIYQMAEVVMVFLCIFQFVVKLLSGETNERLLDFGEELSAFMLQILQFETFNSEFKPFPLNPWPSIEDDNVAVVDAEVIDTDATEVEEATAEAADDSSDSTKARKKTGKKKDEE